MRVSIHQPNFLPWLGFFQKRCASDLHIILDDVQIPKTGGSWSNRVKVLVRGEPKWLSVPLKKEHASLYAVKEMKAMPGWQHSVHRLLSSYYQNAPFLGVISEELVKWLTDTSDDLCGFNIESVQAIIEYLQLPNTNLVRSSSLDVPTSSTARIRDLCLAVGAEVYVCGTGSSTYLDPRLLTDAGIRVVEHTPRLEPYPQQGSDTFCAGLSIMDALFNCGPQQTRSLILGDSET